MRARIMALSLLSFLLFVPALPAQEAKPLFRPEIAAADIDAGCRFDWYGIYLQDTKIGYFSLGRERVKEGILGSLRMSAKVASFGDKIELNVSQYLLFDAAAPYEVRMGGLREQMGRNASDFTFVRTAPGVFDVVQTTGTTQRKRTVKLDFTLADLIAGEVWIRRGPAPGAKMVGAQIAAREFEPKEHKLATKTYTVQSEKSTLVNGVPLKYFELLERSTNDNVDLLSRFDETGRMISGKLGGVFDMRLEPEQEAKNTQYGKDLFVFGMAKVDRDLGARKNVRELVIDVERPLAAANILDGPRQSVKAIDKTTVRVAIGKRFGKRMKATPEEIAEATAETSTHLIRDPKVKALAATAVGAAKTDVEKVRRLTEFVHGYILPTFDGTLPNIPDLLQRRRGDCKSYALLFTNLARASGLPAREVMGLLYLGDGQLAFGGHAWNEVVLDGEWVPIDATFNETEIDATHLCFGTQKDATRMMLESLGKLKMKVVEVNGR